MFELDYLKLNSQFSIAFLSYCQRAQPSEDVRLARQQHYRAVRIAEKILSVRKVTFLL